MKVRKPEQTPKPAYPTLDLFVKSVQRLGVAAFGVGAVGTACAAEGPVRVGGVPPPPSNRVESVVGTNTPPRLRGSLRTPQLAGKMRVEPSPECSSAKTYVVQEGDTLAKIAERFYGAGAGWSAIEKSNPGLEPNRLKVGQKLVIPAANGEKAANK